MIIYLGVPVHRDEGLPDGGQVGLGGLLLAAPWPGDPDAGLPQLPAQAASQSQSLVTVDGNNVRYLSVRRPRALHGLVQQQ